MPQDAESCAASPRLAPMTRGLLLMALGAAAAAAAVVASRRRWPAGDPRGDGAAHARAAEVRRRIGGARERLRRNGEPAGEQRR
jgi:hypothetical protein